MNNRIKSISLYSDSLGREQEFSITHAERLLSIKDCGWRIPDNSNFEFIAGHGIRIRANKRDTSETKKEGADKQSS